jgi:hypothetical protein
VDFGGVRFSPDKFVSETRTRWRFRFLLVQLVAQLEVTRSCSFLPGPMSVQGKFLLSGLSAGLCRPRLGIFALSEIPISPSPLVGI